MKNFKIFIVLSIITNCNVNSVFSDTKSVVLLQGVEARLSKLDNLNIEFDTIYKDDIDYGNMILTTKASLSGEKRFFHELPTKNFVGHIGIIDKNKDVYSFRYGQSDVVLTDIPMAFTRAMVLFDPRIMELTPSKDIDKTIRFWLTIEHARSNGTASKEELNGKKFWRVHCSNTFAEFDYWIEEPTFRVYRVTRKAEGILYVEVNSTYKNNDIFPSEIHAVRYEQNEKVWDRTIHVKKLEITPTFPNDYFTLKSLNIPLNTTVTDYRISKIIGYWDGEKLSSRYVSPDRTTEIQPAKFNIIRIIFIVSGIILISISVFIKFHKRKI
ncbi:MAG: hypothetical protein LBJ67_10440 [Planctomycetaceae bacterium]|jgi:hypothetical protein|nr:hypothetical protein [Planctomycetaceae bacterium]